MLHYCLQDLLFVVGGVVGSVVGALKQEIATEVVLETVKARNSLKTVQVDGFVIEEIAVCFV